MFGWLKRRLGARVRVSPKQRVGTDFIQLGGYGINLEAIRSGAVWSCVHKIASRVGKAEFKVSRYNRETGMWTLQPMHPLTAMLRNPSPIYPGYVFWRTLAEHSLLTGNGYAVASMERNTSGMPMYLMLSTPANVWLEQSAEGVIMYRGMLYSPGGRQEQWFRDLDGVAHVRGPHLDISTGRSASPIDNAAASSIALHEHALEAAVDSMRNSTRFPGIFKTQIPGADNPSAKAYFERIKEQMRTAGKGFTPVLPHGFDYQPLPGMTRDMQLAGDLNWTVQDIARVYGVPLALIQHTAGQRPDIEQLEDGLMRDAVWPVLHEMEAALSTCCLTTEQRMRGLAVKAHISAGGPTQSGQAAMAMQMAQTGVATINEVRAMVGLPPREDGDMMPTTAGAGERAMDDSPSPEPVDDRGDGPPDGDDDGDMQ